MRGTNCGERTNHPPGTHLVRTLSAALSISLVSAPAFASDPPVVPSASDQVSEVRWFIVEDGAPNETPRTDRRAESMLARSIAGKFGVNVIAIISQQTPNEHGFQTVQVIRSRDGKVKNTMLSPFFVQGSCMIDDGVCSYTYLPDDKTLLKEDSQRRPREDSRRAELMHLNYRIRFGDGAVIAGHRTSQIIATPLNPDLEERHYFLEPRTSYPLRLETGAVETGFKIRFDTKDVSFPAKLDSGQFDLEHLGTIKKIEYRHATDVVSSTAKSLAGFTPLVPTELPMGFEFQTLQISDSDGWRALIVRLTDGLVRARVYEWRIRPDDSNFKMMDRSSTIDFHGIRLLIVSDLPPSARRKMLEAFLPPEPHP